MIKNERQYGITKTQAHKFERALEELRCRPLGNVPPLLRKAEKDALQSQLADLRAELRDFERLRSRHRVVLDGERLGELPRVLIQARIAAGLSQKELAQRLGLKEQQIQRYESNDYATAKLARIEDVIRALGVEVRMRSVLGRRRR